MTVHLGYKNMEKYGNDGLKYGDKDIFLESNKMNSKIYSYCMCHVGNTVDIR